MTPLSRRALPLSTALLLSPLAVEAQTVGDWGDPEVMETTVLIGFFGPPPNQVFALDADLDGDRDIVYTFVGSLQMEYYANSGGSASDWPAVDLPWGDAICQEFPSNVVSGDFDGDGDIDLLGQYVSGGLGCPNLASYRVLSNSNAANGDWSNINLSIFSLPTQAVVRAAADFDSDGLPDPVSLTQVFYNRFTGTSFAFFAANFTTPTGTDAVEVDAADLDGDEDPDLLLLLEDTSGAAPDRLAWIENTGGPTSFWPTVEVSQPLVPAGAVVDAAAGDLDADGDMDLAATFGSPASLWWFENLGGDGQDWSAHQVPTTALDVSNVDFGDFDGDGTTDLVYVQDTGAAELLELASNVNGDGSLWVSTTLSGRADLGSNGNIPIDIDEDGDLDLVSMLAPIGGGFADAVIYRNPASSTVYGVEVNPVGSLRIPSGPPTIGATTTYLLDNPLGTQAAGSLAFLALALEADPAFPAGTLFPGFGMAGAGEDGELLIQVAPGSLIPPIRSGTPWGGAGSPSQVLLAIPNAPELVGQTLYAQGLLIDPTPGAAAPFGLTGAARSVLLGN